jgi:lysophospholipase L1-like esterase
MRLRILRFTAVVALVAGSVLAGPLAEAAPVTAAAAGAGASPYDYYLALGDSLAFGIQPNASGAQIKSGRGYADDLAAYLRTHGDPGLGFVDLACPGETTGTMLAGGCSNLAASGQTYQVQSDAAAAFLAAHRTAHILVTLNVGADNVVHCKSGFLGLPCIAKGEAAAGVQLPQILARLKQASGPGTDFLGMNYYDPVLSQWLTGAGGRAVAVASVAGIVALNGVLDAGFALSGIKVADVSGAFKTTDFTDQASFNGAVVPVNVANVCTLTFACTPAPVGPNIHANDTGYQVMAAAFEAKLPN